MPKLIDWTKKKIGRVTIISLLVRGNGGSKWNCKCDCGKEFVSWAVSFKRGEKFECKNCMFERRRGIDLTGRKFGRWNVLKRCIDSNNKTTWHCKCDCGAEGYISTYTLGRKGKSMSCGCLGRKQRSKHINTTLYPPSHGLSKSKFYMMKTSLIHKCYNEKHPSYHKFGGKGITVCDLWRNGSKDMYEWAKENGWNESDVFCLKEGEKEFNPTTIFILKESEFRSDIALKGGYQITYQGETHSTSQWAKILDVNPTSLRKKILKYPSLDEVFGSTFRKMKFVRNPELTKKVCELYLEGKTQAELSKIFKTCAANIRYHLLKEGIELRSDDIKKNRRTDIQDHEVIDLYNQGYSINTISNKLNCSWPLVKNRIKKLNGITRNRSKG